MKRILLFILITLIPAQAQQTINVGTKVAEPFVIKQPNGEWSGVSFRLWNEISNELQLNYEVEEYDLEGLMDAVKSGNVDLAVSPLTITSEREKDFDFSHPYYVTGLSIAVPAKDESGLLGLFTRVISVEFFETVGLFILILFLVGLITWLFERKKNPEEFGDGKSKGLWSSFWFAAVTMTTVGYGDKSPRSIGGRIVALIWMFTAIIIISSITAAIASALTVTQLDTKVKGLNDLYDANVGSIATSSASTFLKEQKINFSKNQDVIEGLNNVANGDLNAFVYDAPIMKHLIKENNLTNKVKVLPLTLEQVFYAYALPEGSELREDINRVLIEKISDPQWENVLFEYFGE